MYSQISIFNLLILLISIKTIWNLNFEISFQIVVISKSWCIYCIRARKVLTAYPLQEGTMEWIDINKRSDGKEILDYMEQITGSRLYLRYFIEVV